MQAKRTNPVLNKPTQGKDSREFLKYLDDIMKKNTGSFGNIAYDTGSNVPYRVGGRVTPQSTQTPSLQWSPQFEPQPPETLPQLDLQQPEIPQYPDYTQDYMTQLSDNPTVSEMLNALARAAWEPRLPTTEQLDAKYQQDGIAYPVQSMADGTVRYNDGSIRQSDQSKPPMPIASLRDGTILWSDGFTRQKPPGGLAPYLAGVQGLSQFIFGQDQTVTQAYGNYNPALEPGSGYNYGTDFRTRDLQQRELYAPVSMRVVQVLQDDGTRWGDQSGHQGYGNSLLVQLPSGEMIRLSHLSNMGQFTVGQVINPGDLIGTPGTTGNTSGEHLDVEYYNKDGQLDNPNNFRQNVSEYSPGNEITGVSPYAQQTQTQQPSPALQTAQNVAQTVNNTVEPVKQAVGQITQQAASTINQANPTGNFDLGITESLQGQPEASKQVLSDTIANTGQRLNLPEMQVSEAAQQGGLTGAARQLAGNVVDVLSTPFKQFGLPDTGLSEAIAGGSTVNTGVNFIPASASDGLQSKQPTRQDYAGVLGQNINDLGGQVQAKAGQGLQLLRGAGEGVKNLISTGLEKLTPTRVVGDQSGSVAQEVGQTTQKVMSQGKNDIRDPFFKQGGAQMYSKYLAPNAQEAKGGALSLDLFSPDFFQDASNVANVFGGTFMGKEATDKFRTSETNKYPMSSFNPIGYGDGEWSQDYRGAVDRYNQEGTKQTGDYNKSITDYLGSIPSVLKSTFSFLDKPKETSPRLSFGSVVKSDSAPNMSYEINPQMSFTRGKEALQAPPPQMSMAPQMSFARSNAPQMSMAPKPVPQPVPTPPQRPQMSRPSLQDYLNKGKTREQYYAETGQQGVLDQMNKEPWNYSGAQMSVGSQQGVSNAINAASSGNTYVAPSGNAIPNYTPAKANMTDASTGLPVVGNQAPYPIARMADGRTRYSDGSIR